MSFFNGLMAGDKISLDCRINDICQKPCSSRDNAVKNYGDFFGGCSKNSTCYAGYFKVDLTYTSVF
jgi:hypothetical protein